MFCLPLGRASFIWAESTIKWLWRHLQNSIGSVSLHGVLSVLLLGYHENIDWAIKLVSKQREVSRNIWATSWENLFLPYANNKGADQPAHPCSLISTFVVCCVDSTIPLLAIYDISKLWQVSVAEQVSLSLIWSQTLKTGFSWRGSYLLCKCYFLS